MLNAISPLEAEHLTIVRARALRARTAALAERPDPTEDVLGALAWTATVVGDEAPEAVQLANLAHLGARYTWREVVQALGLDSGDKATVVRIAQRCRRRS